MPTSPARSSAPTRGAARRSSLGHRPGVWAPNGASWEAWRETRLAAEWSYDPGEARGKRSKCAALLEVWMMLPARGAPSAGRMPVPRIAHKAQASAPTRQGAPACARDALPCLERCGERRSACACATPCGRCVQRTPLPDVPRHVGTSCCWSCRRIPPCKHEHTRATVGDPWRGRAQTRGRHPPTNPGASGRRSAARRLQALLHGLPHALLHRVRCGVMLGLSGRRGNTEGLRWPRAANEACGFAWNDHATGLRQHPPS